ncbi:hypothetical protein Cgig2_004929 [Carnegiea gigantea]|uniref:Uncharacterized protein n=1 Tax=Carnegiea gigantea TaxID=171969 RepID=A0A9Q1QRF7_9CARY|nr:hypothetical protein Cgig2_004929 [Carnegiea gigantea]
MKNKKSAQLHHQHHNGHSSPFKVGKLFDPDAAWDKDQLGDVLHWIRQALALVCGLIWGAIPLVGGIWLILFLGLSTAIVYGYYALILKIDEEEYGGHGALLQEGLFASMTLFLKKSMKPIIVSHCCSLRGFLYIAWYTFDYEVAITLLPPHEDDLAEQAQILSPFKNPQP